MRYNSDILFHQFPKKRKDMEIAVIELTMGEERMQMALLSLNVGTWTLDLATNSLFICNKCKQIIQVCQEEKVNAGWICELVSTEYGRKMMETVQVALRAAASFDVEVPVRVVKGARPKWLRITGAGAFANQIFIRQLHGTVEDISERKNSELLKQDFLAMVSHDLRSPLAIIKLYMQLSGQLAGDTGNQGISEMLEKAGSQVHKMNRMIQCYLETSAIASGKISYSPTSFDVWELLKEVSGELRLLYPGQVFFLRPGPCVEVCADRDKIAQVVQNLLSNAIKYSSRTDVITLHFKRLGNYLKVAVEDHGMGIKMADQEKVFERFYRAEEESGKTVKGYGIGLYLCKEIIQQHRGDIWLKSEVDKGSRFYFTLPLS
jgi:two-component system sensor histidine kinase VicK